MATLHELDTTYTLSDVVALNEALDIRDELDGEAREHAEREAQRARDGGRR